MRIRALPDQVPTLVFVHNEFHGENGGIDDQNEHIRFLVDGEKAGEYSDEQPLLDGSFAFETLEQPLTWARTDWPLGGLGCDIRMRSDNPDIIGAVLAVPKQEWTNRLPLVAPPDRLSD